MRLFDEVKNLLTEVPIYRNSDRELLWHFHGNLTYEQFMKAPSAESITRARRKVQELYPWLQASEVIKKAREEKEKNYPSWVYRGQGALC